MKKTIKHFIKSALRKIDVDISRYGAMQQLLARHEALQQLAAKNSRATDDIELLLTLPYEHSHNLLRLLRKSKSQLRQDLFVLSELGFKEKGFFVEFGATNGVDLSNSYLLEKEFGWNGILAEPAKCWHNELKNNRICFIDTNCVWKDSHSILNFNEVSAPELSTISSYNAEDFHGEERKTGTTYDVGTISLNDLLEKYNAPKIIDYLSVDTEGSEFEILSNVDLDKFQFTVITCEHNFTAAREKIFSMLSRKGYVRKWEKLSKFDDWYVRERV